MIVTLDVGNTSLRAGIVRDGDVTSSRGAPTPSEDVGSTLRELLAAEGASVSDVETLVVASVVPSVTAQIVDLTAGSGIHLVVADETTIPIEIRVPEPAGVGDDRLVNALAAARLYGAPAIVVDMGTATTFDVVSADGAFIGGAIAAGAGLGLDALASRTAQLPPVTLVMPPAAIGRDTISAMQSGAVIGHIGLISELLRAIRAELELDSDKPPTVVLTGGLATAPWAELILGVDAIDPLLTLRGLAILHAHVQAGEAMIGR